MNAEYRLFRPDSIRRSVGAVRQPKYLPRSESHVLRIVQVLGPRGGKVRLAITQPFGSALSCTQGLSGRAIKARAQELDAALAGMLAQGWMLDQAEANRLSVVHAQARCDAKLPEAMTAAGQRQAARFAAANKAVQEARA